jgi:hypothetical protein
VKVDSAFYTCKLAAKPTLKLTKTRPPLDLFVRKVCFRDLTRDNLEDTVERVCWDIGD